MHAKDISVEHSEAERGKVTGTPVGCACGDGVVDWARVIAIMRSTASTACFRWSAERRKKRRRSLAHLTPLLAERGEAHTA